MRAWWTGSIPGRCCAWVSECSLSVRRCSSSSAVVGPNLWPTLILFWFTVSGVGLVFANATTLALVEVRAVAGTGSAVLGASQFGLAAVVAPVVGLGGEATAVPMAVAMLASACIAAVALTVTRRRRA